jgi:hypothetical protein
MSMKLVLNTLAAATLAISAFGATPSAKAMPIVLPTAAATVQDTNSGQAVDPSLNLVQKVGWHRHGWYGHRGWHSWHRHGWYGHRGWHRHGWYGHRGWHRHGWGWHGHHGWHRHGWHHHWH